MSVRAVAWVLDELQGLKPGPTLVMLALADFADERDSCFPGQDRIAARARCSRRSVVTYLRELVELGLVSVESRVMSTGYGGIRRTSNRYILHVGRRFDPPCGGGPRGKPAGHIDCANSAPTSRGPVDRNDKTAGRLDCANSAPTKFRMCKSGLSNVQPVAHKEPPVIDPSVPSLPLPSRGEGVPVDNSRDGAPPQAAGASPGGSAGTGDDPSPVSDPASDGGPARGSSRPSRRDPRRGVSAPCDARADRAHTGGCGSQDRASRGPGEGCGPHQGPPGQAGVGHSDCELVARVLPGRMGTIPRRDHARVAQAIRARLRAGWSEDQIRLMLENRDLPGRIRTLTGLVLGRLRDDVPVDDPPSWSGEAVSRSAEEVRRAARVVAARARRDVIAQCGLCDVNGWRPAPGGHGVVRCDHLPGEGDLCERERVVYGQVAA